MTADIPVVDLERLAITAGAPSELGNISTVSGNRLRRCSRGDQVALVEVHQVRPPAVDAVHGSLPDVDRRADIDPIVEVDDIGNRHPNATVRGGRP